MPEPSPDPRPFHVLARLADLPQGRGLAVTLGELELLLVRDGAAVRALSAKCPHAGAPLAEGAVCDRRLICPWHKASFAVADGALLEPPALQGLAHYPARVDAEGQVLVSPAALPVQAAPPAALALAPPGRATLALPPPGRATLALPPPGWGRPGPAEARHVVILGAGAAGTAAAAALRERGFDGRLTLVGAEPGEPYDRTALSKFVTAGKMAPAQADPLRPAGFFADARVERVRAAVARLQVAERRVTLADGRMLDYDAALLATGSVPNRPDLPGFTLPGVHVLRDQADAAGIQRSVAGGGPAVVLGGSFIGLEVACGLREQGVAVVVVMPGPVPFAKQFGPELGGMMRRLHEANGVVFRTGRAARIEGSGAVEAVVLEDGSRIPARFVVAGLGVRPATAMLEGVALDPDGGVAVDAGMRAAPGLWAAGDLARFPLADGRRVRVEHWRVAQQHARIAAATMLGESAAYADLPFFWTYHYGRRFEVLGHAEAWDQVVVEGSLEQQDFVALLVDRGMVAGAVACQRERASAVLLERMRSALPADAALEVLRRAA